MKKLYNLTTEQMMAVYLEVEKMYRRQDAQKHLIAYFNGTDFADYFLDGIEHCDDREYDTINAVCKKRTGVALFELVNNAEIIKEIQKRFDDKFDQNISEEYLFQAAIEFVLNEHFK